MRLTEFMAVPKDASRSPTQPDISPKPKLNRSGYQWAPANPDKDCGHSAHGLVGGVCNPEVNFHRK